MVTRAVARAQTYLVGSTVCHHILVRPHILIESHVHSVTHSPHKKRAKTCAALQSMVEGRGMIRQLTVSGFTTFLDEVKLDFVPGINVIVGGNDSGKSHLMRLCYALCRWGGRSLRRDFPELWAEEERLRRHLLRAFGARQLSSLVSRRAVHGSAQVSASLYGVKAPAGCSDLSFSFQRGENDIGLSISTMPDRFLQERALFIPLREVLTLYPCYVQVGKRYPDLLDGPTWDLCQALEEEETGKDCIESEPGLRRVQRLTEVLLQGKLARECGGRFILRRGQAGEETIELGMMAEGYKRPGTLNLLVSNGSLRSGDTLFWDEPELNLNTAHLPLLCGLLLGLSEAGVQVILSTHSLFLLRELVIRFSRREGREIPRRFIGLHAPSKPFGATRVQSGETPDEIGPLESLEAEMEQADRYLRMPSLAHRDDAD